MDTQNILSELKKGMKSAIYEMELQEPSIIQTEEVLHRYLDVIKSILHLKDIKIGQISDTNKSKESLEKENQKNPTYSSAKTAHKKKRTLCISSQIKRWRITRNNIFCS
ncbi:hypothetical protein [Bacillus cereus]|uniref:hypothetical protein n=1 Tax=Bacillus cereus TaxID=1396 RepID=UPI003980AB7A